MRGIIKGEGRIKYLERTVQKKRKYPSSEKESVKAAAQNFLEKAACELLGENVGQKGPLGRLQPEVIVLDDD
ncbi:hypothetical protein Nepgr_012405 [Nepenthes gracilis]|uniref:Uncharacterized protein n=1 Tax=Nepenthes gracilis TaxID=150966 RepID=A0AAD3SH84_NEPGR|nr:hypothetical protein Nepgr_012405 [Nepenthes gracilis]